MLRARTEPVTLFQSKAFATFDGDVRNFVSFMLGMVVL
jgi:hypothetical protein